MCEKTYFSYFVSPSLFQTFRSFDLSLLHTCLWRTLLCCVIRAQMFELFASTACCFLSWISYLSYLSEKAVALLRERMPWFSSQFLLISREGVSMLHGTSISRVQMAIYNLFVVLAFSAIFFLQFWRIISQHICWQQKTTSLRSCYGSL